MTLNITILTPQVIYQSADYALFDTRAGKPLATPSTKVVVLSSFDWTGFITYTGIGGVGNKHTSEYVHEWVQKLDHPSFEDVVEMIRNRASLWHTCPLKPGSVGTAMLGRLTLELLHGLLTLRRSIGSRGNEGAERRGRP